MSFCDAVLLLVAVICSAAALRWCNAGCCDKCQGRRDVMLEVASILVLHSILFSAQFKMVYGGGGVFSSLARIFG